MAKANESLEIALFTEVNAALMLFYVRFDNFHYHKLNGAMIHLRTYSLFTATIWGATKLWVQSKVRYNMRKYLAVYCLFIFHILPCFPANAQQTASFQIAKAIKTTGHIGDSLTDFIQVYLKRSGDLRDTIYIPEYGYTFSDTSIVFTTVRNSVEVFSKNHNHLLSLPIRNPVVFMNTKAINIPNSNEFPDDYKEVSIIDSLSFEKQLRKEIDDFTTFVKLPAGELSIVTFYYESLKIPNHPHLNGRLSVKIEYFFKSQGDLLFKIYRAVKENNVGDRAWRDPSQATINAADSFLKEFIKKIEK